MVHTPSSASYARAGDDVVTWLERAGYSLCQLSDRAGKPRIQVGGVNVYDQSNANKVNNYRTSATNHIVMKTYEVVRLGAFCAGKVTIAEILALSVKMAFEDHVKKRQSVLAKRYGTRDFETMLKRAWRDDDVRESSEHDLVERYREALDELPLAPSSVDADSLSSYARQGSLIVDACIHSIHLPAGSIAKRIVEVQALGDHLVELVARGNWTVFAYARGRHPVDEVGTVILEASRSGRHLPLVHYQDMHRLFELTNSTVAETTIYSLPKSHHDDLAALQLCCLFISGRTVSAFHHDIGSRTILSCISRESIKDPVVVDHLDALCLHLPQFLPNAPMIGHIVPYGIFCGTQLLALSARCVVSCPLTLRYVYLIYLPEDELTLAHGAQSADEVSAKLQDGEYELMRDVLGIESGGTREGGLMLLAPFDPAMAILHTRRFHTSAGEEHCKVRIDVFPSEPPESPAT